MSDFSEPPKTSPHTPSINELIQVQENLCLNVQKRSSSDSKPFVVLLHGFTGSAETMSGLADALSGDFQVLSVEFPGHGNSSCPDNVCDYTPESFTGFLNTIQDHHKASKTNLVGYSMGARMALFQALAFPARTGKLIMIGGSPGIADKEERESRRQQDAALAKTLLGGSDSALPDFVDNWMSQPLFETQKQLGKKALSEFRRQRLANSPEGLANSLLGMGTGAMKSLWPELKNLKVPSLLLTGGLDAKFCEIAHKMTEVIPDAIAGSIADCGHAPHLENPPMTALTILSFLKTPEEHETAI